MDFKPFKTGLFVGRFQPIHIMHEEIIKKALQICEKVIIVIGSAQENGTIRNPLIIDLRIRLITCCFEEEINQGIIKLLPLDDFKNSDNNNTDWGTYLMENVIEFNDGVIPDLYVSGLEAMRTNWFNDEYTYKMNFLNVGRDPLNSISSTKVREALIKDNEEEFKSMTNEKIHSFYPSLVTIFQRISLIDNEH